MAANTISELPPFRPPEGMHRPDGIGIRVGLFFSWEEAHEASRSSYAA